MNKLLISTGAALSAVGLLATAPAHAGTLTFGFEVDSSLEVTFNPLLAGNTLSGVTVPNSLQVTADQVTGSFTVLDDPAQINDGSLDLGDGFLNEALLSSSYDAVLDALLGDYGLTPDQVVESADKLFTVDKFQGDGELTSKDFTLLGNPSPFTISYDNATNTVVVDGYDTAVAESCLSTTCLLGDVSVSYGVSLVLSEFITLTNGLLTNSNVALDAEATAAIASLQQTAQLATIFGPTLNLATVVVSKFDAITDPIDADPNGSELDATVTGGLITASVNGQEDPIFSQSLGNTVAAAAPPVTTTVQAVTNTPTAVAPVIASPVPTTTIITPPSEPVVVANTGTGNGGSITITPTDVVLRGGGSVSVSTETQDVPEPSILLGLLGSAALIKRSRKQTVAE